MIAQPIVYEINTWPWLRAMGTDLAGVPGNAWDAIAALGVDAVWLMGVWQRSAAGVAIALSDEPLMSELANTLDDFTDQDVVGSAYCIRDYRVDDRLGGPDGLAIARRSLADRGIALILDFVPNHVAPDHRWVHEHPEYFIAGDAGDLRDQPESFIEIGGRVYANGRDPYFPAWRDVLQLNTFSPALRSEVIDTLKSIARQCDGVRCDMAMLPLRDVVTRTWGERAGKPPPGEYWPAVISAVREVSPAFTFIAEVYWDLESCLLEQGFDHCYDKRLYDALVDRAGVDGVRRRLAADADCQIGMLRFVENHDEPRAASVFENAEHQAAAVATFTSLGAKLLHRGQLSGSRRRVPVQLGRAPDERVDDDMVDFYRRLLNTLQDSAFRVGAWSPCDVDGDVLAWTRRDANWWLVVVNLSDQPTAATIRIGGQDVQEGHFRLTGPFDDVDLRCDGDALQHGIHMDLDPWQWRLLQIEPTVTS